MKKILHTYNYSGIPWEILKSVVTEEKFKIETLIEPTRDYLIKQAVDADYFLVSGRLRIDEEVLQAAPRLRMIQRTGVGTEMLDLTAIKNHNIPVYVNSGINARSVAEHTLTLMLACLKRLPQINADTHKGIWNKQLQGVTSHEIYGKTVAMVGMGNIGRTVAAMLQPFGVKILYTDVYRQSEEVETKFGLTYCESFEEMLPASDILSFHCPQTPENTGMLNKDTLSIMKGGAIVVNTARGKLINPDDLYDALLKGHISAAGLDTHFDEPLTEDYKLSFLDNVILTPHIGGVSYESFYSMMQSAIKNIILYDAGDIENIRNAKFSI